jgi:multidrug efflux pump subunit AcrA (membrane-fusion protein)
MYLALKSLRKHGHVLTHDDDETVPKHSIRLKPDFNLDDYEEKGTVRLQNREKRQKQRKVLTREERLARRREQEALKRQVLRNSPERIRANEARIKARIDAKNEILRLREERRAISAEAKKLAMEARQQRLAERQAEVEQRARDVQERRQQLVTQKANKVAREARVREIDTTNGIYPNMRRKPALTNEIVIEIRTSNPTLVETISAHFHSDPTPLYSEDIAEIAADFGIPVTDVLETLCSAKTASDLPLFRVEDSRVVLAPFALRGKRLLTFQQALA